MLNLVTTIDPMQGFILLGAAIREWEAGGGDEPVIHWARKPGKHGETWQEHRSDELGHLEGVDTWPKELQWPHKRTLALQATAQGQGRNWSGVLKERNAGGTVWMRGGPALISGLFCLGSLGQGAVAGGWTGTRNGWWLMGKNTQHWGLRSKFRSVFTENLLLPHLLPVGELV